MQPIFRERFKPFSWFLSVCTKRFVLNVPGWAHASPSHGLQDGLRQVVRGHHDVPAAVGATPGEDGMDLLRGFPLLQGPVPQIDEELHIGEVHLHSQDAPTPQVRPK